MSATVLPTVVVPLSGIRLAGRSGNDAALRSVPRSHQRRRDRAATGKFAPDANYYPSDLAIAPRLDHQPRATADERIFHVGLHTASSDRTFARGASLAPASAEDNVPHKHLMFRSEAREKTLRGTTAIADAVRMTLGPKSRCVLIERSGVSRSCAENAVSAAGVLLLMEATMTEVPDTKPEGPAAGTDAY